MLLEVQFLISRYKLSKKDTWQQHAWTADVYMLILLPNSSVLHSQKSLIENTLFTALDTQLSPTRDVTMDYSFFRNTQASRHISLYLAGFLYIYIICVVIEIYYLSDLIATYIFAFVFLTQHALWFIIYCYHLQQ